MGRYVFSFISNFDGQSDWETFDRETKKTFRISHRRDNSLSPSSPELVSEFNTFQSEKWKAAAIEMRGNPKKYPPEIAEPILAKGPRLAMESRS